MKYKCDFGEWGIYSRKWAISKCLLKVHFNIDNRLFYRSFWNLWHVNKSENLLLDFAICTNENLTALSVFLFIGEYYQSPWVCFIWEVYFYSRVNLIENLLRPEIETICHPFYNANVIEFSSNNGLQSYCQKLSFSNTFFKLISTRNMSVW